jgi:sugar phosphate isomerase/epimerase
MMKLAFSTLGCPAWDLATALGRAKEYEYDGIDIRSVLGTNSIWELEDFSSNLSASVKLVERSGLEITCFSSSVKAFATGDELAGYATELSTYLELCRTFGVGSIRIFGGEIGETPKDDAMNLVVDNCRRYVEKAERFGVTLLFETHDSWTASARVRHLIESVGSEHLRVVWDVAHPYRHSGEKPQETWKNLEPWVANTHWKDAYPKEPTAEIQRDFRLCLMGDGTLPLPEFLQTLQAGGYDGYFTLEWEKMWHSYLEEPEVAFPQFVSYMRALEEGNDE